MDAKRLSRISGYLQQQVAKDRVPGLSCAVWRKGELVYEECFGQRNVDNKTAMTKDTIVRLYSMTKPITSVAIMMLHEQGKFQLDDPIHTFLPCFKDMKVIVPDTAFPNVQVEPAKRPITFKHLLTHTAGLTYGFLPDKHNLFKEYQKAKIEVVDRAPYKTLTEACEAMAKLPLLFHPGESWNYSYATDVLGCLIEIISGQSFAEFVENEICKPLGMHDTAFHVPENKWDRFAACYKFSGFMSPTLDLSGHNKDAAGYDLMDDGSQYKACRLASGGGGMVGTLSDYMRFCQLLLNKGQLDGVRLLGRKTVEYMFLNHLDKGDLESMGVPQFLNMNRAGQGFGLGFAVVMDPAKVSTMCSQGEGCWGGLASTFFWIDHSEELAVVFLTQLVPSSQYNFRRELRTMVYQALND
eukprot:m.36400 g.36400  ORF g.36400 m.36400 type:complete len:411 (-) comp15992_c0_seq1:85-1317(-)